MRGSQEDLIFVGSDTFVVADLLYYLLDEKID